MGAFSRYRPDQDQLDKQALISQMNPQPATEKMPTTKPEGSAVDAAKTAVADAPASNGYDGSGYGTTSGYLLNAARYIAPQVQAAKSEADAKGVSEKFLNTLIPELQKRGANIGQIKGDKIQVDGHWIDLFRDIGTASDPQYLDMDAGGGPQSAVPTMGMIPNASSSADAVNALTQQSTYEQLLKRMQELNGPEAVDQNALMALMKR